MITRIRTVLLASLAGLVFSLTAHAATYATPVCPREQGCITFYPDASSTVATTAYVFFYSGFPNGAQVQNPVTTVTGNTVEISGSYVDGASFPEPAPGPEYRSFALPLLAPGEYTFLLKIAPDPSYPNPPPVQTAAGPVAGAGISMSAALVVGDAQPTIMPQVGLWWNPDESGTGYSFDVKHGVLVVTVYSYTLQGLPMWYLAYGPIDSNNAVTTTLLKFAKGQCISCGYVAPIDNGNDGTMTIQFTSPTSATMTLPNRGMFTIVPEDF